MRTKLAGLHAVILSFLWGGQGGAQAEAIKTWQVGEWTAQAFTDDKTGHFSFCAATAGYKSGTYLTFSQNRNGLSSLGFSNSAWNGTAGDLVPIQIVFDNGAPLTGKATVVSKTTMVLNIAPTSTGVSEFRAARQMTAYANGVVIQFVLTGTARVASEISECAAIQLAVERGEPPPVKAPLVNTPVIASTKPAPRSGATDASKSAVAEVELASMRIATNLLLQAKLPNARLLTATQAPAVLQGRGTAWTADGAAGAVAIFPASYSKDSQALGSSFVGSDSADCKGDFVSGRSSALVDDTIVVKAQTACKDSAGTHELHYFIMHREHDGYVVFLTTGDTAADGQTSPQSDDAAFQIAAVRAAFTK